MLSFDKENKITFEQLSSTLQDKIRKIVTRSEMNTVYSQLQSCEDALNGVRISSTSDLDEIENPINNKEICILVEGNALYVYVYADNRWIKIPQADIYHLLDVVQTDNQLITLTVDGAQYTSGLNVKYGTDYTASIASTNLYYKAGTLSSTEGSVYENTTITATDATLTTSFILDGVIGKLADANEYGIHLNTKSSEASSYYYGKLSPAMFNSIYIKRTAKSSGGYNYTSLISFFEGSVPSYYNTITMIMQGNNESYTIFNDYSLSNFNKYGSLSNYANFTTKNFYDAFVSLKGKSVKFYISFTTAS